MRFSSISLSDKLMRITSQRLKRKHEEIVPKCVPTSEGVNFSREIEGPQQHVTHWDHDEASMSSSFEHLASIIRRIILYVRHR